MKSNIICASLILALGIFIYSCVSRPSYPSHWSNLSKIAECPNVEGYYNDTGKTEKDGDYKPSLYRSLVGGGLSSADKVEFIKITQQNNELLIEAYSKESLIDKRVADFNSDDCDDGFLKLKAPIRESTGNRPFGVGWNAIQISKATDGDLVLRYDSSFIGFVFLVPVAASERVWYRFPRIEKQ